MIKMGMGLEKRTKAFRMAETECAKFGKIPRVTGHSEWDGTLRYECVTKTQ